MATNNPSTNSVDFPMTTELVARGNTKLSGFIGVDVELRFTVYYDVVVLASDQCLPARPTRRIFIVTYIADNGVRAAATLKRIVLSSGIPTMRRVFSEPSGLISPANIYCYNTALTSLAYACSTHRFMHDTDACQLPRPPSNVRSIHVVRRYCKPRRCAINTDIVDGRVRAVS